jgi:hypothetical protein
VDHARKGGLWFFCKTCESINGQGKWVVFWFLCVVNLNDGVMSMGLSNMFVLRGLCCKVQSRIWVLVEV